MTKPIQPRRSLLCGLAVLLGATALATPATAGQQWPLRLEQILGQAESAGEQPAPAPKDLKRFAQDLSHHELGRREAAARTLVAAGEAGAAAVRSLCDAADPVARAWARRVFGAVHGVQPETLDKVLSELQAPRGRNALQLSDAIRAAGEGADAWVQRMLRSVRAAAADRDVELSPLASRLRRMPLPEDLLAVLEVHDAVHRLAAGIDLGHAGADRVLALGPDAAKPLIWVARNAERSTGERLHALWLHGQIGAPDAAAQLAALTDGADAAVREEALAGTIAALTADSFPAVARAVQGSDLEVLDQLAAAFANRMEADAVIQQVKQNRATRSLGYLVLGHLRTATAADHLADALRDRRGRNADAGELESLALALSHCPGRTAREALVGLFADAQDPSVRAAALAGLRGRPASRDVRLCLAAGLFDTADEVRITATADIGHRGDKALAPALILAAQQLATRQGDDSTSEASRASAVLARLFAGENGTPTASAGLSPARQLSDWERWLARRTDELNREELPWLRGGREARRVLGAVRGRIQEEFFHFGDEDKVDGEKLEEAARKGIAKLLEREGDGTLEMAGIERRIFQRFLEQRGSMEAGPLLSALSTLPFEAPVSDLVRLTNAAASGMVSHLDDPYSRVMPSNNPDGEPSWLPVELEGGGKTNGFRATDEGGRKVVDFVLYDSPAWHAGIRAGDEVVKVGDTFTAELEGRELSRKMNEEADFQILRDGWLRPMEVRLVPSNSSSRHIMVHRVLPGKVGYVRLKAFEPGCSVTIGDAIARMEREDGIEGLILDLRNNPGGTVVDAVSLVDSFVPAGKTITVMERRSGDETITEVETSTPKGSDRDYPLVVLVNRCSASASEMTSGALQGLGRATVIGETSFGKGIGQSGVSVRGFSTDTALGTSSSAYTIYLTILRYYLPEGRRSIHGIGVEPDLSVRRGGLKGTAHSKAERARRNSAFQKYVEQLLEDDRELAIQLAANDGGDPERYPDLKQAHRKVRRYVDLDRMRELVRGELRRRLLLGADEEELFTRLICDLENDRELRAALEQVAPELDLRDAIRADAKAGFRALRDRSKKAPSPEPKQPEPEQHTPAPEAPEAPAAGAPASGSDSTDKSAAGSATGAAAGSGGSPKAASRPTATSRPNKGL